MLMGELLWLYEFIFDFGYNYDKIFVHYGN